MRKKLSRIAAAMVVLVVSSGEPLSAAPPLTLGTISVEPGAVEQNLSSSMPVFIDAVGKVLAAKGFTMLDGAGHARLVADLSLSRVEVGTTSTKVPVERSAIAPGGSSGVGGSLSFALPTSKMKTIPLQQTRLEIRIKRRGEENVIWQGTAITVRAADTREGQDEAVASDLTGAIFHSYPAQFENVISVP